MSNDFLTAVLPSSGTYCAVELSTKRLQHFFTPALDAMDAQTQAFCAENKNAFFALATFATDSRKASEATLIRSLFIDIDCGPSKPYKTKQEAVTAFAAFLDVSGLGALGQPWMVDSGGGVHVYWPLTEDATIDEWKPVAVALKSVTARHGLNIDLSVTADAARVLRPPGTLNFKYDPPRPVRLRVRGGSFRLDELARVLRVKQTVPATQTRSLREIPGAPPKPVGTTGNALALAGTTFDPTYFRDIVKKTAAGVGCGQLTYYFDNAANDGMEPLWRAWLSIAKCCEDRDKAYIRLSQAHPYDEERMRNKIAGLGGPYTCATFRQNNPDGCAGCKLKITSPVQLGRRVPLDNTARPHTQQDESTGERRQRRDAPTMPQAPYGFSYGTDERPGVYAVKKEGTGDDEVERVVQILPYFFYIVDVLQEDSTYFTRFVALRRDSTVFVTVPNKSAGRKDEVISTLSAQNIIASAGSGNDVNLYNYVRACMGRASETNDSLRVPPQMGWQPDKSFAVGDTVMHKDKPDYNIVSGNLQNIIGEMRSEGTVENWAKVIHMLESKDLWHPIAIGLTGFASPLMRFAPPNTPCLTFHTCGRATGAGKSLGLYMAASVWGDPARFPIKANTSSNTMLQRAGLLGSLPLLVDEVTTAVRDTKMEWAYTHIFNYSQGGHKLKGSGSSNSELMNHLRWHGFSVLTSNTPFMEAMMGARETSSEGEARRLLEWHTEDVLQYTDEEREISKLWVKNHGVVGRIWAKWLVENEETALGVFETMMDYWRRHTSAPDSERYYTAGCAAILASVLLIGPDHANIIDLSFPRIRDALFSMVRRAREIIADNQVLAEDIVNAYVRENFGHFVKVSPTPGSIMFGDGVALRPDSTKGRIMGRIEQEENGSAHIFIETRLMKQYCVTRNWSYLELKKRLRDESNIGRVVEERKNLLAGASGAPLRVQCLHVLCKSFDAK